MQTHSGKARYRNWLTGMIVCQTCGQSGPQETMRVISKNMQWYKCAGCHTKQQTLRRMCGEWPINEFSLLSVDDQQSFMSKLTGKSSTDIASILEETLERVENRCEKFSEGGSFLPLSVWERQGWDPETIKNKSRPSDIREDERFGLLYRVPVFWHGTECSRGFQRRSRLQVRPKAKAANASREESATANAVGKADGSHSFGKRGKSPSPSNRARSNSPSSSPGKQRKTKSKSSKSNKDDQKSAKHQTGKGSKKDKKNSKKHSDSDDSDDKKRKSKKGKKRKGSSSSSDDKKGKKGKKRKGSSSSSDDKKDKKSKKRKGSSSSDDDKKDKKRKQSPSSNDGKKGKKRSRSHSSSDDPTTKQAKVLMEKARDKLNKRLASTCLARLGPIATQLEEFTEAENLPGNMVSKVKDMYADVKKHVECAKDIVDKGKGSMQFADNAAYMQDGGATICRDNGHHAVCRNSNSQPCAIRAELRSMFTPVCNPSGNPQ